MELRAVRDADLPVIFDLERDPEGVRMAAFTAADPSDRARFDEHWQRIRADAEIVARVVVDDDGVVLGHVAVFGPPAEREVTYWIGRSYWGRGVATAALRLLLAEVAERPLHARAAADNAGSARVLAKCGFEPVGRTRSFANARGEEIEETLFTLSG
ncbi:GNAT family N-acetyltransferase [Labedaea rhizosphaerae]|uniref:RimJ/RimL family protein N-acetyltransferase n=1 Tax=Labedaea rhizosphaerae TaxID=598644 RepID=A0A4R6SFV3_LABRH|nr:RimJ/RimL family protein N-acetyltransferase [Labedaea rhizosphaerae]